MLRKSNHADSRRGSGSPSQVTAESMLAVQTSRWGQHRRARCDEFLTVIKVVSNESYHRATHCFVARLLLPAPGTDRRCPATRARSIPIRHLCSDGCEVGSFDRRRGAVATHYRRLGEGIRVAGLRSRTATGSLAEPDSPGAGCLISVTRVGRQPVGVQRTDVETFFPLAISCERSERSLG